MKKMNALLAGAVAMGMMVSLVSSNNVYAAVTQQGDTPVTYDNRNQIPDPKDPLDPDWVVLIPSSITFTDQNKRIDTTITLEARNGATLPADDITVSVESAGDYKLALNATDEVPYLLQYAGKVMTNTDATTKTIGILNNNAVKITGEAVLKGTATKLGAHEDKLTYTVSVN